MLKALELHGFKSFADKTRFEFPPGITVVVGPNGSGKSNIVDCIKWVLGEQSAKSLRGKDMADVIFKGSGASGRKPMNTAEATLIFENADKRLPIDAPEVHVTRRVYRSGEGEYLINRQPARLKDIKDLFRGTGLGGDAYSLIEQGKVDRLLQASAKDRRAIFEEAAGISRFKAKKIEAQRRLERVEQNMLRLSDIVEEVENRLKTVRAQASKARRYREYSDRLQQLRTHIALVDWRRLSEQLARLEHDLTQVQDESALLDAEAQRLEARHLELETAVFTAAEELRGCESRVASIQHQINAQQAAIQHERLRSAELDEEASLHGQNLLAISDKVDDLRSRLKVAEAEIAAAEDSRGKAAYDLTEREQNLQWLDEQQATARQAAEVRRQEYVAQLQRAAALASQVEAGETQLAAVQQAIAQHQRRLVELAASETELASQLAAADERRLAAAERLTGHLQQIQACENELAESRNLYASRADDLAQLYGRQQGVSERAAMLEEFERTLEGFGSGVKEVLARAGHQNDSSSSSAWGPDASIQHPWSLVRGVVADLLFVKVEYASAIDIALGDNAQLVVVAGGGDSVAALVRASDDISGRVVAIGVSGSSERSAFFGNNLSPIELTAEIVQGIAVIARADKLVECADEHRPLLRALLGRTFIVRSLADALALRSRIADPARFVALTGELVDEHGAIAFGPRQAASNVVSRRSQLRAARLDLAVLDQQIIDAQRETTHLKREIERHERELKSLVEAKIGLDQDAHQTAAEFGAIASRLEHLGQQKQAIHQASEETAGGRQKIEANLKSTTIELTQAQAAADTIQQTIVADEARLAELLASRTEAAALATAARVELARCDQRLESLRFRSAQFEDDSRERERAIDQVRRQLLQAQERRQASQLAILTASASIAELLLAEESVRHRRHECIDRREAASAARSTASEELSALRRQSLALKDKLHQLSLAAEQVRHQRATVADRLREDYRIELADFNEQPTDEEARERVAIEEEIETLRRRINQIGAVNLDALDELDDLEKRFATLSAQHNDLNEAKQSLERIIHKINADSRRLFLETLEAIRVNFQALYRRAFGGGKADILLEEGVDILECGVEIIATPPGKPSFSNSLLSGGEKALTAVALLLAIFQFRPSPFCILDEVDAPFDEANIGRFIEVLKDFLGWTRFVIVTHSKKTMTAATTLYGITMQESGVSRRVSVRFDDVTEDGHIRREALDRPADEEANAA